MSDGGDLDFSHYFQPAQAPAGDARDVCTAVLFDGSERHGVYEGHGAAARVLRLTPTGAVGPELLPESQVRLLRFDQPVDVRLRDPGLLEAHIRWDSVRRPRPFAIHFRDGHVLAGELFGCAFNAAGIGLYVVDAAHLAERYIVPRAGVREFVLGERLGRVLLDRGHLSQADLDRALEAQREARARRVGEMLASRRIVDGAALERALVLQRERPDVRLDQLLVAMGVLTQEQLDTALGAQLDERHQPLGETLIELGLASPEAVKVALAEKMGVPHVNLREFPIDVLAANGLPRAELLRLRVMPIHRTHDALVVAMADPFDPVALDRVRFAAQRRIIPVLATVPEIEWAIWRLTQVSA